MSIEIDPDEPLPPRADLISALAFMVFGAAIAVGSWRMDRLAHLNINQYEIPGLVPGLLGAAILVLGLALAVRAVAAGALGVQPVRGAMQSRWRSMALMFALTLFYSLGLVGTGVPFWIATLVFVSLFIFLFDRERQNALKRGALKQALLALVYGAATSATVSLAFEKIFLVRLP